MLIRYASIRDIPQIKRIAEETWPQAYATVIPQRQIDFMLKDMYSEEALETEFSDGRSFLIAETESEIIAFCSYYLKEPDVIRLPKLYVLPRLQRKGAGKKLIDTVAEIAKELGAGVLELNLNRNNPSLQFYLKMGFDIFCEEDIPYYEYVLKDYVMRKKLS